MAASPLFLTKGEGVTTKAPATTADAAERDVRKVEGGAGVETSNTRVEETARTARQGEEGALRCVFFFLVRPKGVGAAVGVAASAGERRRFWGSVAKAAAADRRLRDGVDGSRARTSP